jgi:hypothetical protein
MYQFLEKQVMYICIGIFAVITIFLAVVSGFAIFDIPTTDNLLSYVINKPVVAISAFCVQ